MEARTVNNLPPAASHDDDAVRCVLAIELSKKSWIVAVNTPSLDKIGRHTLKPSDGKELLDLCERIRTRLAAARAASSGLRSSRSLEALVARPTQGRMKPSRLASP